jgi:hypothetical protein
VRYRHNRVLCPSHVNKTPSRQWEAGWASPPRTTSLNQAEWAANSTHSADCGNEPHASRYTPASSTELDAGLPTRAMSRIGRRRIQIHQEFARTGVTGQKR